VNSIRACAACDRIVDAVFREAASFGHRIAAGEERGVSATVCADHLPLIVATTSPQQLAAWLSARLGAPVQEGPCFLCEAEHREEASAAPGPLSGLPCVRHGTPDPGELETLKAVLDRIASGERLPHAREVSAIRIALVRVASIRGSSAHIFRIE
jgi:hypothetical protein